MSGAVFTFVGAIVGALLQFLFTRHLEGKRHHREVRAKAYADYLQCVSEHANLGYQRQSPEGRQLGARTAYAKCRISLYGSQDVVSSFAEFEKLGATMNTDAQCRAFSRMVIAMRRDTLGNPSVDEQDIEVVLLGRRNAT